MLFARRLWDGIVDGSITLAFRRWRSARAKAGSRHRTPFGVVEIVSVEVVDDVSDAEAVRAGFPDRAALSTALRGSGDLYRVEFRWVGEDPRIALRERDRLSDEEWRELEARLTRLDRRGPWTVELLRLIDTHPGVRAPDLAASLGRETLPFKRDVRKLKELGLTESLRVGYRLSPRGRAWLARTRDRRFPS
jgi:hypothetical protein